MMKFQICALLLLSFVGLSFQVGPYEQLNQQLVQSGAENMKDGLEVARKYLETVEGDRDLIKAIKQFLELEVVYSDTKECNWDVFEAVQRNVNGVGETDETNNKVSELIMEAAYKSAEDCQETFPKEYKKILTIMTDNQEYKQDFKIVAQLMDAVSKVHFGGNVSPSIDNLKEGISVRGEKDAQAVYQVLETLTEDSNDLSDLSDLEKQAELGILYETYVFEPCYKYVTTLGTYVFMPADLVLEKGNPPSYREDTDEMRQFLRGWAHYRFCSSLIDQDGGDQFLNDLNNLLK